MMRTIAILLLTLSLQGCWFVFIPGGLIQAAADGLSGNSGRHCVTESAAVGQSTRFPDGRVGTIRKLEGFSSRCGNATPVRAVVTFD